MYFSSSDEQWGFSVKRRQCGDRAQSKLTTGQQLRAATWIKTATVNFWPRLPHQNKIITEAGLHNLRKKYLYVHATIRIISEWMKNMQETWNINYQTHTRMTKLCWSRLWYFNINRKWACTIIFWVYRCALQLKSVCVEFWSGSTVEHSSTSERTSCKMSLVSFTLLYHFTAVVQILLLRKKPSRLLHKHSLS